MTEREQIEARIEELISGESSAAVLSHELFRRGGLFSHLAGSRPEREVLIDSPLFRKAQRRLSELQRKEMEEFRQSSVKSSHANEVAKPTSETELSPL